PKFRASVGDYLIAARAREPNDGRSRALAQRWREYLNNAGRSHHPVFSPYLDFTAIPADQFATKAPALAQKVAGNDDSKKPVNALGAKAFAGKAPESLAEVAKRYGAIFKDVDERWQQALKDAAQKKQPAPTKLPDADGEAVRQILYGPASPTN